MVYDVKPHNGKQSYLKNGSFLWKWQFQSFKSPSNTNSEQHFSDQASCDVNPFSTTPYIIITTLKAPSLSAVSKTF